MKKLLCFIILPVFIFTLCAPSFPIFAEERSDPDSENALYPAKSALLAEAATGQVLFSQNGEDKLAIASVTKIMTLLIAAERIEAGKLSMDDTIVASHKAFLTEGSVIWLNEGEKMSAYDILRSIVISSANDACVALAEHISGSEEEFVKLMNKRAEELGMKNTNFVNCTGLDENGHFSTAADVAKMAAELRKYDYFDEFLTTRLAYVREDTDRATQLLNTNKLLGYEGITGLKTGTTDAAGYCFVATAKRNDMELIAVVLGAENDDDRFDIAEKLLDRGFEEFELFTPEFDMNELTDVSVKNGIVKTVPIYAQKNLTCLIPKGKSNDVSYLYSISRELSAPVEKGDVVGRIFVMLDGETLFSAEVKTESGSEEQTFFKSFLMILRKIFSF